VAQIRILPLGGLGEIGMNCLAIVQGDEALVIDCGISFDNRGLGVDIVCPRFDALRSHRVVGVFLTHGHEDHIGALPYFLRSFDVPVWGTAYTLGLVRQRAEEHEVLEYARLHTVVPRERIKVGGFDVEPIRVTHSIADATALAIRTAIGTVIHTGDFKFDATPADGEHFDEERLSELGDEGVALLMSDSTNVDTLVPVGSESLVGQALEAIVGRTRGAVVIAQFASNVHRLKMLGDIALKTDRNLFLFGRSLQKHASVGRETGYLKWPGSLVLPNDRAALLDKSRVLAIASGTQAEANAALARLARDEYPMLKLDRDDAVVMSARIIPGNEPGVFKILDQFLRRDIAVHTWLTDRSVHVSGHASRPEQQRMLELVRPRAFVPLHGTLHHLRRHADVARDMGVENVAVLENGDVAQISAAANTVSIEVERSAVVAGRRYFLGAHEVPDAVLREREQLARGGIVVVVVRIDGNGVPRGPIEIGLRGIAVDDPARELREAVSREAMQALAAIPGGLLATEPISEALRRAIRRVCASLLGYKPEVMVQLCPC
jgi:ribonuclease J